MKDLQFNICAFMRPSTPAEFSAALDEAIRMGDELLEMIEAMEARLAANAASRGGTPSGETGGRDRAG